MNRDRRVGRFAAIAEVTVELCCSELARRRGGGNGLAAGSHDERDALYPNDPFICDRIEWAAAILMTNRLDNLLALTNHSLQVETYAHQYTVQTPICTLISTH